MSSDQPHRLSPEDLDILFEPDPPYDLTETGQPLSPFAQFMREMDEVFYSTFPDARRAAEQRRQRKRQLQALLSSRRDSYGLPFTLHALPDTTGESNNYAATPEDHCMSPMQSSQPLHYDYPSNPPLHHTSLPPYPLEMYDDVPALVPAIPKVYTHEGRLSISLPSDHNLEIVGSSSSPTTHLSPPSHPQSHHRSWSDDDPTPTQRGAAAHDQQPYSPTSAISDDHVDHRHSRSPSTSSGSSAAAYNSRSRPGNSSQSSGAAPSGLSWSSKRKSATMPPSPVPAKQRQLDKKPPLACLFCRGRKIACGAPPPGSVDKTCNQCHRRSLNCVYPAESRRGMRKKKTTKGADDGIDEPPSLPGEFILSP